MRTLIVLGLGVSVVLAVVCQVSDRRTLEDELPPPPVTEASLLDRIGRRVSRAARNVLAVAGGSAQQGTAGIVDPERQVHGFVHASTCAGLDTQVSPASIHPPTEVLPWLAFERGDLFTHSETALRHWVVEGHVLPEVNRIRADLELGPLAWPVVVDNPEAWAQDVAPERRAAFDTALWAIEPGVDAPAIFAQALVLTDGDVYRALLTAHNFLRSTRIDPGVQTVLVPLRQDNVDNSGAYYHLFGMATYAVAYDAAAAATDNRLARAGLSLVSPEVAATIEETFVSEPAGDVGSDPTEYAVDLLGVQIGRAIAQAVRDGAAMSC